MCGGYRARAADPCPRSLPPARKTSRSAGPFRDLAVEEAALQLSENPGMEVDVFKQLSGEIGLRATPPATVRVHHRHPGNGAGGETSGRGNEEGMPMGPACRGNHPPACNTALRPRKGAALRCHPT